MARQNDEFYRAFERAFSGIEEQWRQLGDDEQDEFLVRLTFAIVNQIAESSGTAWPEAMRSLEKRFDNREFENDVLSDISWLPETETNEEDGA